MQPNLRNLSVLWVSVAMAACGGSAPPASSDGFAPLPSAELVSSDSDLRVALHTVSGETPVRGNNRLQLMFAPKSATAFSADPVLDVELSTFMPAMGHGSGQAPRLVEVQASRYTFDNVVLNMPGLWELRLHVEGDITEDMAFEFDVE